VDIVNSYR